jgi:hypothetical protein
MCTNGGVSPLLLAVLYEASAFTYSSNIGTTTTTAASLKDSAFLPLNP